MIAAMVNPTWTDRAVAIDPKALTPSKRRMLEIIHDHTPSRSNGGYGKFPHSFVALKTGRYFIDLGLARLDHSGRGIRLMLTGQGINTYTVMMQRKQRGQG